MMISLERSADCPCYFEKQMHRKVKQTDYGPLKPALIVNIVFLSVNELHLYTPSYRHLRSSKDIYLIIMCVMSLKFVFIL